LNILQPPEWRIFFEDRLWESQHDGPWSSVAQLVSLDGLWVYETIQPVQKIEIIFEDTASFAEESIVVFMPPSPRPCFALKHAMAFIALSENDERKDPLWLSTRFGYLDQDCRVILTVAPAGLFHATTPRSTPFSL
jgi:hypothetical protein